jgi:hypothetical protein
MLQERALTPGTAASVNESSPEGAMLLPLVSFLLGEIAIAHKYPLSSALCF